MIVPMKKVSLIIKGEQKQKALEILRKTGMMQVEITEGFGEKLNNLGEKKALLESALFTVGKKKKAVQKAIDTEKALSVAKDIAAFEKEKKQCADERVSLLAELDRLQKWGGFSPETAAELAVKGYEVLLYEMPLTEYEAIDECLKTVRVSADKTSVKFLVLQKGNEYGQIVSSISRYRFIPPQMSCGQIEQKIDALDARINELTERTSACICYFDSIKDAIKAIENEIEFETYSTGMASEELSSANAREEVSVCYFEGYIEAENTEKLKQTAFENAWGLVIKEPCEEDNVPTKLKNNKFVSLIYPLTDFLGTVPGYFEYDISAWFLMFILIFFGIIFGDGGYGLLITAIAAVPVVKALVTKKTVQPAFLLVGLFGLSTMLWGLLTCTWFGLSPEQLPQWLKALSVPVISNVYADKIWYPFWTDGAAGLTTAQNLQIFCFTLALIQLTVAHIKGAVRNRRSLKILGDIGSILQLTGIYYVVLSLVVNAQVFSFGLVLYGIPVGTVAVALIGTGFVLSFVFSNYEGSIVKSIVASLVNIVSVLLGVVNVFSDIVSYIRLWAVGLAGAAISATVNELAGPLLGNFMFMILAIVLLVFGHGLNMVLNILSVIVHGIRLNTLEFSSHLDMSWSGHKFKPFKE